MVSLRPAGQQVWTPTNQDQENVQSELDSRQASLEEKTISGHNLVAEHDGGLSLFLDHFLQTNS